ncbi:MAG: hypothetical protein O2856_05545 [Planctomycetota bacterium]|nr:hypothetical protein [Planctomycetota bacterium]
MPTESVILEPPVSSWPACLAEISDPTLAELRQHARKRLVDSAEQFVLRLSGVAGAAGLLQGDRPLLTGDPTTIPIVMTGHQPVVFHSGLTFKYQTAEAFAARNGLIAIAVVIDTDEGDAGAFSYASCDETKQSVPIPASHPIPRLTSKPETLAKASGLYSTSRLKSAMALSETLTKVENQLQGCGETVAASAFRTVADQYLSLADSSPTGCSTMDANLITRWNADVGGRMLELPLSAICSFPEFIRFTAPIFERPFEFADCYNCALATFREDHRIRNEANPFPNLSVKEDWCELPYWLLDHSAGTRHLLQVRRESDGLVLECNRERIVTLQKGNAPEALTSLLFSGKQLVPRGAMITATLRLLFSDLFIHGTGGGKYDPCTDGLIRNWWLVEPSPFAVASASRYLFAAERTRLLQLQQVESQLREMQYNPQRFIGTGVFPTSLEEPVSTLLQEKETAVQALKTARETQISAKDPGRNIQRLTDAIKTAVSNEFELRLVELRSLTDQNIAAITSRTWPWFLFAEQSI